MNLQNEIEKLSNQLVRRRFKVSIAESCTGGLVAKLLTDKAGSSIWFDCAFITYSNEAKQQMLGVDEATINQSGAVSQPVVFAMAEGAISHSSANIATAITGIAGPGGGTIEKPVGMVWIAWSGKRYSTECQCFYFEGDRDSIRKQAAETAIAGTTKFIIKNA